ncbi:helix-turn-helix domain-containing protein [Actinoplanes sp. NPDC049265]|uniref:helix-turn-helix domain-containing protein n=1 Tax=Actinoplanes sp. NPDC049265 TaxID=3363902 RepID=UPI0037220826
MLGPARSWTLERNDRRLEFAADDTTMLFAESAGHRVTWHTQPAWKVVLTLGDGLVEADLGDGRRVTAPGVIVPPQLPHACVAGSAYLALVVDPWTLRPARAATGLDAATTRRIVQASAYGRGRLDVAAARAELVGHAGAGRGLDPRVAHAVRGDTDVNLSLSRLRALVRAEIGIPLSRLRQWSRLRLAMAELPHAGGALVAASAGFADQAHLTRTARALVGRTPSEFTRHPGRSPADRSRRAR